MKTSAKLFFTPAVLLAANLAWADAGEPCGPPGAYVSVGETETQMLSDCGQPSTPPTQSEESPTKKLVKWFYEENMLTEAPQEQPIPETQVARYIVEFTDGKVSHIYDYLGAEYDYYNFCGPTPATRQYVKLGMTMSDVKARCGPPSWTSEVDEPTTSAPIKVTVYNYQFDPTVPSLEVTVKEGKVTDIKTVDPKL